MKKRNGFTLIEIIAAIVILGIIAIIAFATYTSSLRGFRDDYYESLVRTTEESGEEFFNDNRNYRPNKILYAQKVSIGTLEAKNYINKVVDYNGDACEESSYVLIVKEGKNDFSYHTCLICQKDNYDNTEDKYCESSWLDSERVKYTLGDIDDIYVYKGTTKEELKDKLKLPVSYTRELDNGGTISIRGTGEGEPEIYPNNMDVVNANVEGTYKVEYEYNGEKKTANVIVYENLAPTISYKKEQTRATNVSGDTKKVTETYDDNTWAQNVIVHLSAQAFTESGVTASRFQWNKDGRWQDFCTSDPCDVKIETEMNQTVQFRMIDSNGKISKLTIPITIKIDHTKPKCTIDKTGTMGENSWYVSDVNVAFTEKMDQNNDNHIISGVKKYNIYLSGSNIAGNRNIGTVNKITHNTDIESVSYVGYIEDEAENFNTCDGVTFKRDATAPKCTNSGDNTTWKNTAVTINWGCDDTNGSYAKSGCNTSYSGGSKVFNTQITQKTYTVAKYTIKDNAGNTTECAQRTANVYYDKENPTCGTWSGQSTTWTKDDRTISVACSDSGECAQATYSKTFNSGTTSTSSVSFTISDKAGNTATCTKTANVYVDKDAPTCGTWSGQSTTWTKDDRTISVGCSDGGSQCAQATYSKTFNSGTTKTSSISLTISDNVGNTATCTKTANVYVDKDAPTCSTSKSNTGTTAGVTVTVTCTNDGNGSTITCPSGSTGVKSNKTYTVSDAVGNSSTCSVTVTAQIQMRTASCGAGKSCAEAGCKTYNTKDCNCSNCHTGSTCGKSEPVQCSCPPDHQYTETANSCGDAGGNYVARPTGCTKCVSTCKYGCDKCDDLDSCKTYKQSRSKCGCETWGNFGSWSNATSCTAGESSDHHTKTECQTLYS